MSAVAYSSDGDTDDEVLEGEAAAVLDATLPEPSPVRKAPKRESSGTDMGFKAPTAVLALAAGIAVVGVVLTKLYSSRRKPSGDKSTPAKKSITDAPPRINPGSKPKRPATRSG